MADITRDYKKAGFPLTSFMCRLVSMTDDELRQARPMRAANTYGISPNVAAAYIQDAMRHRGMTPPEWKPVEWPPSLAQLREMRKERDGG